MNVFDVLMLISMFFIWLLLINMVLVIAGYSYYVECEHKTFPPLEHYPMVSVLVPAHNESKVITATVESLLRFDYPHDYYEIIVVNDNSKDNSAEILEGLQKKYPDRKLKVINTDAQTGGKGKSRALNIALKEAQGEFLAIYDADNTPETTALRYLVTEITSDDKYGAVLGKFRTRNKDVNLLTRFINIETLAYQWMAQAGRWKLFKLSTIPGTNYIIRRSLVDKIGGWDENALSEDTEVSFRLYLEGYSIKFMPLAVTWEQEPQTLKVWFRQRSRWVQGNVYVIIKNLNLIFKKEAGPARFDIYYMLYTYFFLLGALIISDVVFVGNALGWIHTTLAQFKLLLWFMAIVLFVLSTYLTITTEKGEMTFENLLIIILMYVTYSKLWMAVAFYGLIMYIRIVVTRRKFIWDKTERFDEV